ncbi:MAG: hypothetical protein JO345_15035 [Streptosporangiaceae bacterium]|nr:hypothetical protein [Streptosporangiaceae bacterium]
MPGLDIRIMAHPSRTDSALSLRDRLAALDPVLVWDTAVDGPPSATRTARTAWSLPARGGATHRVVLQDDVVVADDFAERLMGILARRPASPVGLFAGWGSRTGQAVRLAAYQGLSWAPALGPAMSATGVALPEELAARYAAALGQVGTEGRDSVFMYDFLMAARAKPIIAVPNLVEHDWPYTPSLWPEKFVHGPRRSACFLAAGGRQATGDGLERVEVVPRLSPDVLRSRTGVYDGVTGLFTDIPSWRYAQRLGFGTPDLMRLFADERAGAARRALSGYLDVAFQYEIWLTGFLSGRVLAGLTMTGIPDLASPAARAASRTCVTGCLSRVMPTAVMDAVAAAAVDLVEYSVLAGLDSVVQVTAPVR